MARQVRSEATRRKLLDAAVSVFSEVGYRAAGRVAIIERAGVTKGALYHHFDSMEALAAAIIDEGAASVLGAFDDMCRPSSPAVEGVIHGVFAAAEVQLSDEQARVATQLALALGEFNDSAVRFQSDWLDRLSAQTRRGITEGDLRADLDPVAVGESVVGALFGTWLLLVPSSADLVGRLTRMWQLLLPALATDAALPYLLEFLARSTLRHQ